MSGPTVLLRTPRAEDDDLLYRIASELATWEERGPASPAPLTRTAWDARQAGRAAETGDARFVVEADGVAVGTVGIFGENALVRHAEVGIALVREARGHGIGTAALRRAVDFAFDRRNLRRLHLQAIASNAPAIHAYARVGFTVEGALRQHAWVRGRYEDIVLMGLLRSERPQ